MSHIPTGYIGFFNDAAMGAGPAEEQLDSYSERLGMCSSPPVLRSGVTDLRASGYVRLMQGEACVLIDAAPIGPDYLPGHAHADTLLHLSFRSASLAWW